MEGAATTVYAQGGRGNARLMAWEGERTVTFNMEDALISPAGFMILSGAGLIEASEEETIKVHTMEQTAEVTKTEDGTVTIELSEIPYWKGKTDKDSYDGTAEVTLDLADSEHWIYVMLLENGEPVSEPYIPVKIKGKTITLKPADSDDIAANTSGAWKPGFATDVAVLVDYYVEKASGASQIEITPDKFGGNYYLEASTLFRDTNGVDMPAEFVIPNCKIQSNFTFTMAATGDPSTFNFVMDAFPDYTRFDQTKKVLAAIQIISETSTEEVLTRERTRTKREVNSAGQIVKSEEELDAEGNA